MLSSVLVSLLSWLGGDLEPVAAQAVLPQVASASQVQASAAARLQQRQQQDRQIRPDSYDLQLHPVTDANEGYWRNILWTTTIVEPQEPYVADALSRIIALAQYPVRPGGLSRSQAETVTAALRVSTQLYLKDAQVYAPLSEPLRQIVNTSSEPTWVAMALAALKTAVDAPSLAAAVQQRFANGAGNLALQTTLRDLDWQQAPQPLPPLSDLLAYTVAPGELQLYVLCRPSRAVACTTLLKDRLGRFVRQENSQLWSVPLLTRSLHDLSWNFTRGSTPQGIHRIEGTVERPDPKFFRAFGQFPLVQLFVPYERGVKAFLPGQPGTLTGSIQAYTALLPAAWRDYWPVQQSYWAGRLGRSLFRIHGTGEAPGFFTGSARHPDTRDWSPAIGCLSARELYDDTGTLQQADMPRILSALAAAGGSANFTGYLIVLEVPDTQPLDLPVSLNDLATLVAQVETQRSPVGLEPN